MSYPKPIHWWVDNVLPLVYSEALSYMEVVGKITEYVNGLTTDMTTVKNQIEVIEAEIEQIDPERIADLLEEMDSLETLVGGFEDRIEALESAMTTVGEKVSTLEGDVDDLETVTGSLESSVQNFGDRLGVVEESTADFDERIASAENIASTASSNVAALGLRVDDAEAKVEDIEDVADNIAASVGDSEEWFTATRDYTSGELVYVGDTLYKAITNITSGDSLVIGSNISATTVSDEIVRLNGESSSLDSRLDTAENDIDAVEGRLDTAESDIDAVEDRLDTVESDIDAVEGRLDTAESDIDAVEGRLDTAESDIDAVEGRLDTAESDIDAVESDIDAVEGRLDTAESDIDAVEGRLDNAESDINNNSSEITNLKSAITQNATTILQGYWEESWVSGIGGNLYKSDTIIIPAGTILKQVRYKPNNAITSGSIFVVDANNKILFKYSGASISATDWNTVEINQSFDVDSYIVVSGFGICTTYSSTDHNPKYSTGLWEGVSSQSTKVVGDTITFTQNVPERYYSFAVDVTYEVVSINSSIANLSNRVEALENEAILPEEYPMPLVVKSTGTYTLIGRWFDHRLDDDHFTDCCNCGGQSIMFKIKGATSVNVKFGEVSRYPDNEDFLMVNLPYCAFSVDGSAFTREQIDYENGNDIPIADTNEHFVWVVVDGMDMITKNGTNRTSGWVGVYLDAITTSGTTYAIEPKNRQILFVGDSMVEGINTLGTTSTAPSNSATAEFPIKTARKLNSVPLLCGYGGQTTEGLIDWVRYSYASPAENKITLEPDLIILEPGHNDYSQVSGGTLTEAQFITNYKSLISILRGMYTGVPILCIIPFKQYLASAIRGIAAETECCYVIETADYSITYSDGTHPDAAGATSIANSLSADVLGIMGKEYFSN